jgi:hypothetical protein
MASTQRNRKYKLTIGDYKTGNGLLIEGLQVSFDISKSSDNTNNSNSASIEVTNLSNQSLKILQTDYPAAVFEVGYESLGNMATLFAGQVVNVSTRKQGTERVTQLVMGAGYTELNHSTLQKLVPAGKTVKDVVEELKKSFPNISRGVYNGSNLNSVLINGYSLSGSLRSELDRLSKTYNLEWRLDGDTLYVNNKDRASTENFNTAYVISPSSGLIEIPYYVSGEADRAPQDPVKKQSVQFSMLINPNVSAGEIIKLEDTEITGWYKVDSIRYSGSWRNGDWLQEVSCSAIEKVVKNK